MPGLPLRPDVRGYNLMIRLSTAAILLCALLLGGCVAKQEVPFVYRPDIQQGNVVTKEMLSRLEPGMEKRKVRFLLGTPLVVDTFNQNRWDYVYTFNPLYGDLVQRRVSLFFDNERLARLDGDVQPLGSIPPQEPRPS